MLHKCQVPEPAPQCSGFQKDPLGDLVPTNVPISGREKQGASSGGCCQLGEHHYTERSFHSAGSPRKEERIGYGNVIFQSPVL